MSEAASSNPSAPYSSDNEAFTAEVYAHVERLKVAQKGEEGVAVDAPPTPEELAGKRVIFNNRRCPFGHRAWWALKEKGRAVEDSFDYLHVDLGDTKPEWYKPDGSHITPLGTVPVVYDHGNRVLESNTIVEWLDERFPDEGARLMPEDPAKRGAVRALLGMFSDRTGRFYALLMAADADEERLSQLRAGVHEAMAFLETRFAEQSKTGPYFLGADISAADIAIMPFIDRFIALLKFYRDFDMFGADGRLYPRLLAAYEACRARPAFASTAQGGAWYCAGFIKYAKSSTR